MQVLFKVHGRLLWILHATALPSVARAQENEGTKAHRVTRLSPHTENSRSCEKFSTRGTILVARENPVRKAKCRRKQGVTHGPRPLSWRCVRRACSAALNVVELVAQCGDLVWAEAVDEPSKCLGGAWARELCT